MKRGKIIAVALAAFLMLTAALAFTAKAKAASAPTQTATFRLTWTDNSNNEDGFRIYRCQGASCTPTVQIGSVGANVTTYDDAIPNDLGGVTYTWGGSAFNSAGESSKATGSATSPIILAIPGAPSGVAATVIGVKLE